jgi:ribose-phosphate pyrophosphokinase
MKLLAGSSHIELAEEISNYLNIPLTKCILGKFNNNEIRVEIKENIRNEDIFIIQTGANIENYSINDILMETMIIIDACKRSNSKSITLIMPFYPYARQDKKNGSRSPISAKVVANMLQHAGINRLVVMDLHAQQIQGFFDIPVDNLYSLPLVLNLYKNNIFNTSNDMVIMSPDAGGVERALKFGKYLKLPVLFMHKERNYHVNGEINKMILVGDASILKNKTILIMDDMTDTCGTIIKCAEECYLKYNVKDCIAVITHGVFSKLGLERISQSKYITQIYSSNSLPKINHKSIHYFSISELIGRTIQCLITGNSISDLFC